ncbi:MAG: NAD(P)H-binding protein [Chloroflexi bacterium]|nr:NAD(P)H-binding protein [Chloroflexota bacterium]
MDRTILVAGATGYLGSNFIEKYLGKEGVRLVPIVRRPRPAWGGLATLRYDELPGEKVAEYAGEHATLLHLIGSGRETSLNAIYEGNVASTRLLVQTCRAAGIQRIVYLSGYGVQQATTDVYYRSKAAAEEIIRGSGLSYAILRPSYIVGGNDELTPDLIKQARNGTVLVPGDGRYRIQPLYLDDVLQVLFTLATDRADVAGVFDLLGPPVPIGTFLADLARRVNPEVRFEHQDLALLMREAIFGERPRYSLSELAILVSDAVGEPTGSLLGVELQSYAEILDHIIPRSSSQV